MEFTKEERNVIVGLCSKKATKAIQPLNLFKEGKK